MFFHILGCIGVLIILPYFDKRKETENENGDLENTEDIELKECKYCGEKNPKEVRMCNNCGAKIYLDD